MHCAFVTLSLFLTLVVTILAQAQVHHSHSHSHSHIRRLETDEQGSRQLKQGGDGRCGVREPNFQDLLARLRAQAFSRFRAARYGVETVVTRTIPVCFHNPSWTIPLRNKLQNRHVSNEELQKELDHLNEAYSTRSCCDTSLSWCKGNCSTADVGLEFVLAKFNGTNVIGTTNSTSDPQACITRRRGDRFMSMSVLGLKERRIKKAMHIGDESTLNIYYIRPLFLGVIPLLGFATFPWDYTKKPKLDGVVIEPSSVVGGKYPYGEGDTTVHEVGHWLGLYHTFQGGCRSPGDGIADTPPEAKAYYGCTPDIVSDTCPGGGPDPIFNFMDYSTDECMYEFTADQAAAIISNLDTYRNPAVSVSLDAAIPLTDGIPSESYSLVRGAVQLFSINIPSTSVVTCNTSGDNGNVDLFMNWDGDLEDFNCTSETAVVDETCSIGPGSGTAYEIVSSVAATTNFAITCTLSSE